MLSLDEPSGATLPRDVVYVQGWCLLDDALPGRIEITLDGGVVSRARLGLGRFDVAEALSRPLAVVAGFDDMLDLSGLPEAHRRVVVGIDAFDMSGLLVEHTERAFDLTRPDRSGRADPPLRRTAPAGGDLPERSRLRLAAFTHDLQLAGAQLWLSELLARAGAGRDFDCTVVSPADGPLRPVLEGLGIAVEVRPEVPWQRPDTYEAQAEDLASWLASTGHTAVLANTVVTMLGADAGRRMDAAVLWVIHESWPPAFAWEQFFVGRGAHPALRQRFVEVLGGVDGLVFEAEATRRLFEGVTAAGRAVVVPYGIDIGAVAAYCTAVSRAEARAGLGLEEDWPVLLALGSIEPRKSQTVLAATFAELARRYPEARLVLAGGLDNRSTRALGAFVRAAEIEDRVLVLAHSDQPFAWLRAADVLVSASDVESMPRTMLEAMAFGLPVAGATAYGVGELVVEGETGYLFPTRDRAALASGLARVLDDGPARWSELGERGRRRVAEGFDSAGYAGDFLALYRGLLDTPGLVPQDVLDRAGLRPEARLDRSG